MTQNSCMIAQLNLLRIHHDRFYTDTTRRPYPDEAGHIGTFNYSGGLDFFAIDFGLGKPSRGVHWTIGEPVKVARDAQGNFEVHITTDRNLAMAFCIPQWLEAVQDSYGKEWLIFATAMFALLPFLECLVAIMVAVGFVLAYIYSRAARTQRVNAGKRQFFDRLSKLPGKYLDDHGKTSVQSQGLGG